MKQSPNQSIEPTGGSRFWLSPFASQWRLPPVAHAHRCRLLAESGVVLLEIAGSGVGFGAPGLGFLVPE